VIKRATTKGIIIEHAVREGAIGKVCGFEIAPGKVAVCECGLLRYGVGEIGAREINVDKRATEFGVTQAGVSERTMGELRVKVGIELGLAKKAVLEGGVTAELAETLKGCGVKANT
tara:strand:+ start:239 stop:586 length:348 start_codon:yes stop_codon:yes gene_type:complete